MVGLLHDVAEAYLRCASPLKAQLPMPDVVANVDAGVLVISRFEWLVQASTPTWKQSYSWDGGATWEINWVLNLTKV